MTYKIDRFTLMGACPEETGEMVEDSEGEWVKARPALDRIRVLEESLGILTTICPNMKIDSEKPMKMARQIFSRFSHLEAMLTKSEHRAEHAEARCHELERDKESTFEVFHRFRTRLSEVCRDPYLMHTEALEAIIKQRDEAEARVRELEPAHRAALTQLDATTDERNKLRHELSLRVEMLIAAVELREQAEAQLAAAEARVTWLEGGKRCIVEMIRNKRDTRGGGA